MNKEQISPWEPGNFNFAPDAITMTEIQTRVTARLQSEELIKAIKESLVGAEGVPEEAVQSSIMLSMYINTAFELGKENAFADVDQLMKNKMSEMQPEETKETD